ncbi:MAG: LysR family transcriptional regulator, partial [Acidimicrobiaceae bacterium]|nr:LysR family transcriptional regulator [Acidimicrobiaceae bacterium]
MRSYDDRVDLRQLEHFLAVAEEQSFTRAARRIHAGQSTLSVSVRSLERELGTALFERTTHRVALTDAGEALLPEARRTLEAAERAREVVAEVNGVVRGTLRVGIMRSLKVVDVASMLARFHRKYPGVEIQPRPAIGGSAALAQQVATGQLDLAFLAVPPDPVPDLSLTPLASEPFLLVAASDELDDAPSVLALNEL